MQITSKDLKLEQLTEIIQLHVHLAPFIIFGALLLAGFNIPISEDAMIIISALLAVKNPHLTIPLFIGVYMGAYWSDIICYTIGRKLGHRLWTIKFFAKMVSKDKVKKVSHFYAKYGIITLLIGRFIPFGVRNGLFLTAGLGKMNFAKFALSDLVACTISNLVLFILTYKIGDRIIDYVRTSKYIIFGAAIAFIIAIIIKKKFFKSNKSTL